MLFYILGLTGQENKVSRELVILKERFAKGELSEEEYIRRRDMLDDTVSIGGMSIRYFGGIVLMTLGIFLIMRNFIGFHISLGTLFPLLLICVGLIAVFKNLR